MATESAGKERGNTMAVLVVMLVFALGMAAGAGAHASFEKPRHPRWDQPGPGGQKRLPPPLEELDLTADQRTKAEAVFEKYRQPLEALFEETRPRMNKLREEMDGEFQALLTEQQRAKFTELKAKRPPHRGGFGGPPPPGAPPPPPP